MKLSCLPVSYFDQIIRGRMSVGDWAREAASLGLDAIDISILFLHGQGSGQIRAMRREIESCGLRVAMVTTYPDFTHPDPEVRAHEAAMLERDLAAASEMSAEMVRITAGQAHPDTGKAEGLAWAVEGLTAALSLAQHYGIQVVFENHSKPGVWDYADFAHPTEIFLSVVGATAGTGLGINFDTANTLVAGDDPLPVLAQVMDRLVSIHAADTATRGALSPTVIGTGLVPFADIFDLLHSHGFDGWICIEEASGTGRAGVESAVAFVRQAWSDAAARLAQNQSGRRDYEN